MAKAKATIHCETVAVIVTDGRSVSSHIVPAYTRPEIEITKMIRAHLDDYTKGSAEAGAGMSLGDFALYLIGKAADEPRVMTA